MPVGGTQERRTERALIREYEQTVEQLLKDLSAQNHAVAVKIASLPEDIRGFGHIKMTNLAAAAKKREQLLLEFSSTEKVLAAA